eukprot:6612017-Pyramimonas_sp.AAC.1
MSFRSVVIPRFQKPASADGQLKMCDPSWHCSLPNSVPSDIRQVARTELGSKQRPERRTHAHSELATTCAADAKIG